MNDETPAQLVDASHAHEWVVARHGAASSLLTGQGGRAALQEMVRKSNNLVARFHAMWTLEGLGALDARSCANK